ncbi:pollen-specific leucine-rich repeat extensin-like protein 3 [Ceratitis capitata]|uniref:pollen-specific leucine-rich repeat extensin-like protein 3 n=1 Tax=Ceratitis capitata TaxID=7213 RepID=UPI00061888B7|nr:pollen-specific leucine-rich repeat extensin-like protein 3 [Ceratitis capitata]
MEKFLQFAFCVSLLTVGIVCTRNRHKRSIYGLDSTGPYLPAPFGPVPFAPFGLGSPYAQPPFALPYSPYAPPPYATPPHSYPLSPFYPPQPYHNPIFAPAAASFFRPPPFPPLVAPATPVGPPPAPIIVPAKTAAALSIASIIHAFIARKFYPPVLPVPIARPIPYPVPERSSITSTSPRSVPTAMLGPMQGDEVMEQMSSLPANSCAQKVPQRMMENFLYGEIKTSTAIPWQPTVIPISE